MELERKKTALVKLGYGCAVILLSALAVRYLWMLLLPFLLGFLIAYLLRPVTGFISRHSGMGRRCAAIVSAVVFYAVLAAVLWLLGLLLFVQMENLGEALPPLFQQNIQPRLAEVNGRIVSMLERFSPALGTGTGRTLETLSAALENAFASLSAWAMEGIARFLSSVPTLILATAFTILSSVLICADYDAVAGFVMKQIPARLHKTVLETRDFVGTTLRKMLKAYFLLTLVTFGILCAGLWILGVDRVAAVAGMIALLDLLPVLGSGAVLVPWGIYGIVVGDVFPGIGMLVLWGILSAVRQILEPRIVGDQIGLHPLVTLCAMYGGWKLAGFWGILVAPVICLLVKYLQDNEIIRLYKK